MIRTLLFCLCFQPTVAAWAADGPSREAVSAALRTATEFQTGRAARHGGYVYASSADLSLREGEGTVDEHTVWVQPPGTPTVGEAFLKAYAATGDELHLEAARAVGECLRLGQLQSGGWTYSITFDPENRSKYDYRLNLAGAEQPQRVPDKARRNNGWDIWKTRQFKGNVCTLDDDTTQAATRFLIHLDRVEGFKKPAVHEAATYALESLLGAQYPNGGYSANYDRFPLVPPSADEYPIVAANYPDEWSTVWPKTFAGCYVTNDDLQSEVIDTLLLAAEVYGDNRYLEAAKRAGDFLLLAQMPEPQPGWAQQYNKHMQPEWSRAFEPPAVSGWESQPILLVLMKLTRATGDRKYLTPIPRAIDYLRKSALPNGQLARFYELKTNTPIYFERGPDGKHVYTHDSRRAVDHYGWQFDSKLDRIEQDYQKLTQQIADGSFKPSLSQPRRPKLTDSLTAQTAQVIGALNARGAWVTPGGRLKHHKVTPPDGIIDSQVFAKNIAVLSEYLEALTNSKR